MITEHLMRPGSGSVRFTGHLPAGTARQIRDLVTGAGCHVVITAAPVPDGDVSDEFVLASAIYTGRVIGRPSRRELRVTGLSTWLDTYPAAAITRTGGTPTQWLGDLLTNGITTGTVSGGSNVTRSFPAYAQTNREALDAVASLGGWEYDVRPDFTVDAGTSVFTSPPRVVITDDDTGPADPVYVGLRGGLLDHGIDVAKVATHAYAVGADTKAGRVVGSATQTVDLKTPAGGTPTIATVVNAPSETSSGNADDAADTFLITSASVTRTVKVSTATGAAGSTWRQVGSGKSPQRAANSTASLALGATGVSTDPSVSLTGQYVRRVVRPGDEVYLWDIEGGFVDLDNAIDYRGETIHPDLVRVVSMTWPIEQGLGVYVRSNAATPTYIDVTSWVQFEAGDTFLSVGDWDPAVGGTGGVARALPLVEARVGGAGIQSGTVSPTLDANGDQAVTFGSAFPAAPVIVATVERVTGLYDYTVITNSITTTGFKFRIAANNTILTSTTPGITVHWIAYG